MRTRAAASEIKNTDKIETRDGEEGSTIRERLADGLWYEDGDQEEEGWTDRDIHKISDVIRGWREGRTIFDYSENYEKWIENDGE